jgi:hypothetical protein
MWGRAAVLLLVWLTGCVSIAELQTADLPRKDAENALLDYGPGAEDAPAATDPGRDEADDAAPLSDPAADSEDGGGAETDDAAPTDTEDGVAVADTPADDDAPPADIGDAADTEGTRDVGTEVEATDDLARDEGDAAAVCDPLLGCGRSVGGWTAFDSGAAHDEESGLWWSPVFDQQSITQLAAICASFGDAEETWRLPTVDEARSRIAGCTATHTGGSCPISDPGCLTRSCVQEQTCAGCTENEGPRGGCYLRAFSGTCPKTFTSSECSNCGAGKPLSVDYASGTVVTIPATRPIGGFCVTTQRAGN